MNMKDNSSLLYMVLVLSLLTLVSAAGLSYINELVKEPIARSEKLERTRALKAVLPAFDNDPLEDKQEIDLQGRTVVVYPGRKQGKLVGLAFDLSTKQGYGGEIVLLAGFLPDGTVNGYYVLASSETPGLGDRMKEDGFKQQFHGWDLLKNPDFKVVKDGGKIQALTAATITSRAVCDAFNQAHAVFGAYMKQHPPATAENNQEVQ